MAPPATQGCPPESRPPPLQLPPATPVFTHNASQTDLLCPSSKMHLPTAPHLLRAVPSFWGLGVDSSLVPVLRPSERQKGPGSAAPSLPPTPGMAARVVLSNASAAFHKNLERTPSFLPWRHGELIRPWALSVWPTPHSSLWTTLAQPRSALPGHQHLLQDHEHQGKTGGADPAPRTELAQGRPYWWHSLRPAHLGSSHLQPPDPTRALPSVPPHKESRAMALCRGWECKIRPDSTRPFSTLSLEPQQRGLLPCLPPLTLWGGSQHRPCAGPWRPLVELPTHLLQLLPPEALGWPLSPALGETQAQRASPARSHSHCHQNGHHPGGCGGEGGAWR
ncbi:centromere protein X isoform X1 [Gorilla gorilla gorilla]|uniref:centromere protein X isoform X1 n=1 Tax=Gorilla gorilla gorilla TaxID=9595 RepID=UPI00244629FB|nr:centromere protein X isoform X1 [Gorilla gorilla gorilla]